MGFAETGASDTASGSSWGVKVGVAAVGKPATVLDWDAVAALDGDADADGSREGGPVRVWLDNSDGSGEGARDGASEGPEDAEGARELTRDGAWEGPTWGTPVGACDVGR